MPPLYTTTRLFSFVKRFSTIAPSRNKRFSRDARPLRRSGCLEAEREKKRAIGWEYGKYNCPVYEGDIDFRRAIKILRGAGCAGDLCIEDESLGRFPAEERGGIMAKEIRHLKECM